MKIKRIAQLRTPQLFQEYLDSQGIELGFDAEMETGPDAPLAQPFAYGDRVIGNRFACCRWRAGTARPMAAHRVDHPSLAALWAQRGQADLGRRGRGRAPRRARQPQPVDDPRRERGSADRPAPGAGAHPRGASRRSDDLLVGLQLTHSGRFARPNDKAKLEPRILYRHPLLDAKFGITPTMPSSATTRSTALIDDFVAAAVRAQQAGFDFVDVKHCHGYLGHEFLSAVDRPGKYGGSFENRTRFLREMVAGIRAAAPGLDIGVRLSAFDFVPFQPGADRHRRARVDRRRLSPMPSAATAPARASI